jgi:hypothetical protein
MASTPTNWSASVLAAGKQAVATVLDKTTGVSNVLMAMSLA